MKFYECKTCGNIMVLFEDAGVVPVCCGTTMECMKPQCEDGAKEKHVPIINVTNNVVTVTVGEVPHPMEDSHYIKWILLETNKGKYLRKLEPNISPSTTFNIDSDEKVMRVYEYCNLHSLWVNNCEKEQDC